MSRGVISTARPGLIGRLLRIDDWRSIELWADVLVIERGVWRQTVALDKVVDWMIAARLLGQSCVSGWMTGGKCPCAAPRGDGRSAGRSKAPCWASAAVARRRPSWSAATTFWRCLNRWAKL